MRMRRKKTSKRWSRSRRSARRSSTASPIPSPSRLKSQRERGGTIEQVTAVVIGAGHLGLAASRCLTERSIDHVVLERGEVAESWRRQRWDSLRLLTPNWQSRLPGFCYEGTDPDGFMTMPEVIAFISRFAQAAAAPVRPHTVVTSVRQADDGYHITTDSGELRCRCVVLASGACNLANVPGVRQAIPPSIECVSSLEYRNPGQLPEGGVLVVGASA